MPAIAVVGASSDRSKFGNKAVRAYLTRGWTVFPVNPGAAEIEGLLCHGSLRELTGHLERVALYLPPDKGLGILQDLSTLSHDDFLVNPGAESDELLARARELGLQPRLGCAILDVGERPSAY